MQTEQKPGRREDRETKLLREITELLAREKRITPGEKAKLLNKIRKTGGI